MDHSQFKANQTAAIYVADELDTDTQEAFELHMMDCTECVNDVEIWRAIKLEMPGRSQVAQGITERVTPPVTERPAVNSVSAGRDSASNFTGWRMAASILIAGVVGATGGWFGRAVQSPALDSTQTVIFNMPSVTRGGGECTTLGLAADTRVVLLRVPGVAKDLRVVALDPDNRELPTGKYASRVQPDGSHLLRIDSDLLAGRAVRLEARSRDGSSELLGCVSGETSGG